jgi:hypothetical protein
VWVSCTGNGDGGSSIGNLGGNHANIPVEIFWGFAIADPTAPFIVINDQDAHTASFFHRFS